MQGYELTDFEWNVIAPLLPNKPRGIPRVDDRRVLNGTFWVLRTGAPWGALPKEFGPPTTCYNRFARWRKAGVWDRIMAAVSQAYDGNVQMIDSTSFECISMRPTQKRHPDRCMGRSRGGLTTKIHALTDANGLPVELVLTPGQAGDCPVAAGLLGHLRPDTVLLDDKVPIGCVGRSKLPAPPQTFRRWSTGAGSPVSARCSIARATASSGSSTASNISDASQPVREARSKLPCHAQPGRHSSVAAP